MTEEEKATTPAEAEMEESEQPAPRITQVTLERVIFIAIASVAVTVGFYLLLYFQTGAWQVLAEAVSTVLAGILLAIARPLARRGKIDAAGYCMLLAVVAVFGVGEILWANETSNNVVGPIILIVLINMMLWPRRWGLWIATGASFAAYIWLVNWLQPLPRFDTAQLNLLHIYDWVMTAFFALIALWQIARAYRRITTIRTRLLIVFVLTVLLPATAIAVGVVLVDLTRGQQQTTDHLESVATLKEAEIDTWLSDLQSDLESVLYDTVMINLVNWVTPGGGTPTQRDSAHTNLTLRFRHLIEQRRTFQELFLMDPRGEVVMSTDITQEGKIYNTQTFFQEGTKGPFVSAPFYSVSAGQMTIIVTYPVLDNAGKLIGVLAGRTNMATLDQIMGQATGLGNTGQTYLVGLNKALLTEPRLPAPEPYIRTVGVERALYYRDTRLASGSGLYVGYRGEPVIGIYRWLPGLQIVLLAERDQAEALAPTYASIAIIGAVALVAVVLAILASLFLTRSIANPVTKLAATAGQIAAGNLELTAEVNQEDEIGALARAFNQMTRQLRNLIAGLEAQVAERTQELQQANYGLQRRAVQFEASIQVGRAITSILNLDDLLTEIVNLIRDRFGFYHAGIFMLDESGEWAVLRQATGEAGQRMLARKHQLAVGGQSIVGWVTGNRQPRVVLNVGADTVHFKNPDLPHTRSEMALPLVVGDRLLGALDVQSTEESAFDQEDVAILSLMADQVAIAIDNALKFSQEVSILEATSPLYRASRSIALATSLDDVLKAIVDHVGFYIDRCAINLFVYPTSEDEKTTWLEVLAAWDRAPDIPNVIGTRYPLSPETLEIMLQRGMDPLVANDLRAETGDERLPHAYRLVLAEYLHLRAVSFLPLVAAGQVVGLLMVASRQIHTWTEAELRTLRSLSTQVAGAVENARLFQQVRARAAREQTLNQMTARFARSLNVDSVLQNAVRELGQSLQVTEVAVHLALPQKPHQKPPPTNGGEKTTGAQRAEEEVGPSA
jgi:GAF domain-containing protein/HAMP domain-containing protein